MRPVRSESGTTLIELLVTIAIMGIAFVGVVGGIGTAIIGADYQERGATSGIVLTSAAEKLVADSTPYRYCDDPGLDDPTRPELPYPDPEPQSGYDVAVNDVLFLNSSGVFTPCPTTQTPGAEIQLIRLKLTPPPGPRASDVEYLEVVKRAQVKPQVNQ